MGGRNVGEQKQNPAKRRKVSEKKNNKKKTVIAAMDKLLVSFQIYVFVFFFCA